MTTKKPPAHGSTARYKGAKNRPPCRCRTCLDGHNRAGQLRTMRRSEGVTGYIPAAPIRAHIQTLLDSGMSQGCIARLAKVAPSTVNRIVDPTTETCFRTQATRILAVRPRNHDANAERPALGSTRRVRGLYLLGHNAHTIAAHSNLSRAAINALASGAYGKITADTEAGVKAATRVLGTQTGRWEQSRKRALLAGWAPISAWDDLDDPNGQPDWTGSCGTDRGWWIHRAGQQAACPRCTAAHHEWLGSLKGLPDSDRFRTLAAARASAASRGAAIAEDGRELFRQGFNRQQVAERLGIGPSHLDHELARHPETDEQLASTAA